MPEQLQYNKLNIWQRFRLSLLRGLFCGLSLLPLRVHYILSDILFFIIYYLIRYRRHIVKKNLAASFPEKSEAERRNIERDFYHWFCDYLGETIKLTSITPDRLKQHMKFENTELLNRLVHEGKSVILMVGHYCNWEWLSSVPLHVDVQEPDWFPMQVYHPLENPVVDTLFLDIRSRMGVHNISMKNTLRTMVSAQQRGIPCVAGFIADQVPLWEAIHVWINFLSHSETPFFTGGERIAKKLNYAMVYIDPRRERRGYYVATFRLMTENTADFPDYQLTEQYAQLLEETIRRQPAYWLWTHNRWKRTREEYNERMKNIIPKPKALVE